jgi:hypothetical protein
MRRIGIFPQNIRNCFPVKQEAKILTRKEWALVSWTSAVNAERPGCRPDGNENRVGVINAKLFDGEPCGRDPIDFLLPLYGPMSRGGDQPTGSILAGMQRPQSRAAQDVGQYDGRRRVDSYGD